MFGVITVRGMDMSACDVIEGPIDDDKFYYEFFLPKFLPALQPFDDRLLDNRCERSPSLPVRSTSALSICAVSLVSCLSSLPLWDPLIIQGGRGILPCMILSDPLSFRTVYRERVPCSVVLMDNAGQHWQPRVIEDMLEKGVVIIPLTPRDFSSSPPGECACDARAASARTTGDYAGGECACAGERQQRPCSQRPRSYHETWCHVHRVPIQPDEGVREA